MEQQRFQDYQQQFEFAHRTSFSKEKTMANSLLQEAKANEDLWLETYAICRLSSCCISLEEQEEAQRWIMQAIAYSEAYGFYDLLAICYVLQGRYHHRQDNDSSALDEYCKALQLTKTYQLTTIEVSLHYEISCIFYTHAAFEDALSYATLAYHQYQTTNMSDTSLWMNILSILQLIHLRNDQVAQALLYKEHYDALPHPVTCFVCYVAILCAYVTHNTKQIPTLLQQFIQSVPMECIERYYLFAMFDQLVDICLSIQHLELSKQYLMRLCECSNSHHALQLLTIQRYFIKFCEQFPCSYDRAMLYQDYFQLSERVAQQTRQVQVHAYRETIRTFTMQQQNLILQQQAELDEVTQLRNRTSFQHECSRILQRSDIQCIGIAMCDIDNFKDFNDAFGHLYGDQIIRTMSDSLRLHASKDMIPYRFGGDEFLCLFLNKSNQQIHDYLTDLFSQLQTEHDYLHISAGYSTIEKQQLTSLDQLIQEADIALYQAKSHGKNQFRIYQK